MYVGRASQLYGSVADKYPGVVSHVPQEEYLLPLGQADVKRVGTDITVVATMMMVHKALRVAEELDRDDISLEVIDPRTLVPLDTQTILSSVAKTGRLIVASEDGRRNGSGAGIIAQLIEGAFQYLRAPVKQVAALDIPIPYGATLEGAVIPQENHIVEAVKAVLRT
jgi:pyruvate dehydrogenase E1 component beta subunit